MQPASVASPLTQVDEPVASHSLADSLATSATPHDPASLNSPTLGEKPARPPKAAQRPSTGSVRQDPATTDAATMTGAEAGAAAPVSSVEKVDDAAASSELATADAPAPAVAAAALPAHSSENASLDTPKRSSTAEGSLSAQTGESSVSKAATSAAAASTSTSLPSASPATATKPAPSPSPAPAPAPAPAAATRSPTAPTKKKRKGGPFSFLLACIPCVSSTGHDDTPANAGSGLPKRPSTAGRIPEQEKRNAAEALAGISAADASKEKDAGVAPPLSEKTAVEPTPAQQAPVEPESAITPTLTEPLVAASSGDAAAAQLAPPPTSAPSARGTVLSQEETEGVTSGAVVPPGQAAPPTPTPTPHGGAKSKRKRSGKHPASSGTEGIITSVPEPGAVGGGILLAGAGAGAETSSEDASSDEDDEEDEEDDEEEEDEEAGLIARGGVGIPIGEDGLPHPLLEELSADLHGRKCLVLDLDETLVHSSFKMVHQADYVVPVEIENQFHNVYVIKRPGVDAFLKAMGEIYEVVVFTASLSKYADPVLDQLDVHRVVKHRLFRESCYNNKGNYVKDLSQLGRPISESIIIDNSPASYVFHPNNAVPISSWFNDPHDTELTDLVPFLADLAAVDDVRSVLDANLYPPAPTSGATDGFQQL
ncbi:hypothetical protein JCM10450v2_006411 [Rhodotorula kratochvilovae]